MIPAILFIAYLLRPVRYIVDNDLLIIKKGVGEKRIALNEISEIREVTKKELGSGIRVFGVGGFFGYMASFVTARWEV